LPHQILISIKMKKGLVENESLVQGVKLNACQKGGEEIPPGGWRCGGEEIPPGGWR
jgi:hypothetical protein